MNDSIFEELNKSKISLENENNINNSQTFLEPSTKSFFKFFTTNEHINDCKICHIFGSSFKNNFNKERHIRVLQP